MATIADVAERAGVGIGTVSRVLNDSHQVRPDTRTRVLAAIDELGYRPSGAKRGVRNAAHGFIGVVVPYFDEPSVSVRLRGLMNRLQPNGFEMVLYNVDTPDAARRVLQDLPRSEIISGLVVLTLPLYPEEGDRLAEAPFPTVLVDTTHPELPSVTIDDVSGGRLATDHLIDLGHERIAFIGEPPRNAWRFVASRLREQGYREAMRSAGMDVPPGYVKHGVHLRSAGRQMANELLALPEPPTAIVTASDIQSTGVLQAMHEAGRRIPDDVSVVGYDDIDLASYIGLTTVRQPLELSGRRGADIVLAGLAQGRRVQPFEEQLRLELVVRDTSGPAPGVRAGAASRRNG